ncbi:MAG: 30S ribosomal protein S16 [Deltaproteobacteria bacterium]|nr:30S ribosomal protein S16 [Deltaproteobacteria bacterium]
MVKLRLARYGAKKKPFYRIIAADSRARRDGRFLEILGTYDPLKDPAEVKLNEERVRYWLKTGAQPTETVGRLLKKNLPAEKEAASNSSN